MSDPFATNSRSQLVREAQRGIAIVALLSGLLAYIVLFKYAKWGEGIPEHVRQAPIAQPIWPYSEKPQSVAKTDSNQNSMADTSLVPTDTTDTNSIETSLDDLQIDGFERLPAPRPIKTDAASRTFANIPKMSGQPTESPLSTKSAPNFLPAINAEHTSAMEPPEKQLKSSSPKVQKNKSQTAAEAPRPYRHDLNDGVDFLQKSAPQSFLVNEFQKDDLVNRLEKQCIGNDPLSDDPTSEQFVMDNCEVIQTQYVEDQFNRDTNMDSLSLFESVEANLSEKTSTIHYDVQPGDSFWGLAQKFYGDGNYFRALYEANRNQIRDFDNLMPGMQLCVPSAGELREAYPALCPVRASEKSDLNSMVFGKDRPISSKPVHEPMTNRQEDRTKPTFMAEPTTKGQVEYRTQSGDTLFSIAAEKLGQASRYLEIWELNRDRLPTAIDHLSPLPVETVLRLPTLAD